MGNGSTALVTRVVRVLTCAVLLICHLECARQGNTDLNCLHPMP